MHIIFGKIYYWFLPILIILRYFKFKVFYLKIGAKADNKRETIAIKLKNNNVLPLPLEFEKNFLLGTDYSLCDSDPDEFVYKKNLKLIPDRSLIRFCNLFSINQNNKKKLRLLVQDFIFNKQKTISGKLGMWSSSYPHKKIIYVSFDFVDFYTTKIGTNLFKIIIPIDIFYYLIKFSVKFSSLFLRLIKNAISKSGTRQFLEKQNLEKIFDKRVAIISHKGIIYGTKDYNMFEKSLYYSSDPKSCLNKYNILHLDYSNFSSSDKNIYWVNLKKMEISRSKIFFETILFIIKTFYLIRSWSTFLGWILCLQQYNSYIKYCEVIKKFKNLKIALIDYEVLCQKTLIFALEKNNVKTIATQERFITTFYKSFANVVVDTYFTISEFTGNFFKNSKYCEIKNIIPIGQYRSDYIPFFKKESIPNEVLEAKSNGKKILVILAHHVTERWFESHTDPLLSWSAQMHFLEDILLLSKYLPNTFIVIRYKYLNVQKISYFKDVIKRIKSSKNIVISNNYHEPFYSYKLCANADLIIAKHTSLGDECLSHNIPVLFYEYTHNMKKVFSHIFDYSPSNLMCYNFEELLEKSKSLLINNSSKIKDDIEVINNKYFKVKEKGNIKDNIIRYVENLINDNA